MKKRIRGRRFGRERDTRRALFRSLVGSLVEHGEIKTSLAKAKAIQPLIDKLIVKSKKNLVSANRDVFARLGNDKKTAKRIFEITKKHFKTRNSGFTRIIKLGRRRGDGAEIVKLEFVEKVVIEEVKPKKEVKSKKKKAVSKKDEKKEKKTKKNTKKSK